MCVFRFVFLQLSAEMAILSARQLFCKRNMIFYKWKPLFLSSASDEMQSFALIINCSKIGPFQRRCFMNTFTLVCSREFPSYNVDLTNEQVYISIFGNYF